MAVKYQYYTWQEFEEDVERIVKILQERGWGKELKNIYGFPRGGLVLAVCLSHRLKIPLILDANDITKETLLVDDITDTGRTLCFLSLLCKTVTLFYHRQSMIVPDIWLREKKGGLGKEEDYVLFPWEEKKE